MLILLEHPLPWVIGILIGYLAAVSAAIATRVRLLPEVIDVSIVPTGAGTVGLLFAFYGAARRFGPDRLGRVTLLGNLLGGVLTLLALLLALLRDVLF